MLSNTVGEALRWMKRPEVDKTVEFVLMFDKLFDCLNVKNLEGSAEMLLKLLTGTIWTSGLV